MTKCLVALGSNLGDRAATLDAAISALAAVPGVEVVGQSAWQMTIAVGNQIAQPDFLNGAALLETSRGAADVLALLEEIEDRFGRDRHERWGDRTLDLDLLLYGDSVIDTSALVVPHPRMSFRRFALEPAVKVAAAMMHPTIGWTLERLLEQLDSGADFVAIVSRDETSRGELADWLAERFCMMRGNPPLKDRSLWPENSTTWLAVPQATLLSGRPKLSLLLDLSSASEANRGPLLRLSSADRDEVRRETSAAIQAVWPRIG